MQRVYLYLLLHQVFAHTCALTMQLQGTQKLLANKQKVINQTNTQLRQNALPSAEPLIPAKMWLRNITHADVMHSGLNRSLLRRRRAVWLTLHYGQHICTACIRQLHVFCA